MGKASKKLNNIAIKIKESHSKSELIFVNNMDNKINYTINNISLRGELWKKYYKQ